MPALTPAGRIFLRYPTELYILHFSPFGFKGFSLGRVCRTPGLCGEDEDGSGGWQGKSKMSKVTVCMHAFFLFSTQTALLVLCELVLFF